MTSDEFPKTWRGRVVEAAKLIGALSIICGFFGGAWSITYGPLRDFLDQWAAMQINIAQLQDDMAAVQGEDRVIRETPGMTYVAEPVYQGENIRFNFVAERTRLGEPCILIQSQSIFTDAYNVPTPGSARLAARQVDDRPTPLQPTFTPPPNLRPGRVTVYLILTYQCDGKTVFDRTSTAAFELLEGPRPKGE
ncbi:hypothetical protein [Oceaniglobus trochenteri]|uniref:hypothetical protein n=1 Tax=Oceaniglobus trochenteri TaxID=2763260 RepID=UPI001CFFF5D4|nr:hypothetical protein [Oceaniglobus trochenteri]